MSSLSSPSEPEPSWALGIFCPSVCVNPGEVGRALRSIIDHRGFPEEIFICGSDRLALRDHVRAILGYIRLVPSIVQMIELVPSPLPFQHLLILDTDAEPQEEGKVMAAVRECRRAGVSLSIVGV